jgi:hypothetical protein
MRSARFLDVDFSSAIAVNALTFAFAWMCLFQRFRERPVLAQHDALELSRGKFSDAKVQPRSMSARLRWCVFGRTVFLVLELAGVKIGATPLSPPNSIQPGGNDKD